MPGASKNKSEKVFEKDKVTMMKKVRDSSRWRNHGIHLAQEGHCSQLFLVRDWQQGPKIS
jgi:hypothetical protein